MELLEGGLAVAFCAPIVSCRASFVSGRTPVVSSRTPVVHFRALSVHSASFSIGGVCGTRALFSGRI